MTQKMIALRKMKSKKVQMMIRMAALACCPLFCILCGCGNGEEPKPAAAADWSEEPDFKKKLEEHRVESIEIGKRRSAVAKRMDEMTSTMKETLATQDEKKVAEELEKNAEWRSLKEKAAAIDAEFEAKRQEMLVHVHRQMNKGNISK